MPSYLVKAALPHLASAGGNLVAVSSVSGDRGDRGQAAYNATKAAISNFVRSLALDWGGAGVRLNAVAPAFTLTELTEGVGRDDESPAPHVNRIALGRPGEPADVAPVVLFAGPRRRALRDRRRDAGRRRDERLDRAAARQTPMAALRRVVR
jgi:meso-butanediol dehydrogenase/(S,S)-butanediol dehydrogenase/diacetyl reductase